MDRELLREFMANEVIPQRTKFDDYLPVVLGVRQAAQMVIPAELPDAGVLGATIDDRFRQKMSGRRLPGESLQAFVKGKMGKYWRRNQIQEIRYRMDSLREVYKDVVLESHSYRAHMGWADKLGLRTKELECRPTIREVYLYTDPALGEGLQELQGLRKDIRYEKMRSSPGGSAPAYTRAFPEEQNPAYLKRLGAILGFPLCCIDRYVFDRESGVLTPEVRASDQLLHMESPEDYDIYAYFTKDFFPCQPDCSHAAEIGRSMHRRLGETDAGVAEEFLKHLAENVALVRQYPEIIRKRIEALEKMAGRPQEGDTVGE